MSRNIMFILVHGEEHLRGVGVIMSPRVSKCMMGYWALSDMVLVMKIRGKPFAKHCTVIWTH